LTITQHAKRDAGFHAQRLDRFHHFHHRFKIAILGSAPRRTHAKARCAVGLGRLRCRDHFTKRQQVLIFHPGGIARCLRAIAAIFGAAPSFYRQQCRKLHCIGIEVAAVRSLRAMHQIAKRQRKQGFYLRHAPFSLRLYLQQCFIH
jgi:hypothetical protein